MNEDCFGPVFLGLTEQDVRAIVTFNNRRCEVARNIGGIAHQAVVDAHLQPPPGWHYDLLTAFWIPPHVNLDALMTAKPN